MMLLRYYSVLKFILDPLQLKMLSVNQFAMMLKLDFKNQEAPVHLGSFMLDPVAYLINVFCRF